MSEQVVEGGVYKFHLVGKNASGKVVPLTDATAVLDVDNVGTVTVNPDGTNGVFTAVAEAAGATVVLTGKAGGKESAPFPIDVVADNIVATVEVVSDQVATVEVQPTP